MIWVDIIIIISKRLIEWKDCRHGLSQIWRSGMYWSGRTPNREGAGGTSGNAKSGWIMGKSNWPSARGCSPKKRPRPSCKLVSSNAWGSHVSQQGQIGILEQHQWTYTWLRAQIHCIAGHITELRWASRLQVTLNCKIWALVLVWPCTRVWTLK